MKKKITLLKADGIFMTRLFFFLLSAFEVFFVIKVRCVVSVVCGFLEMIERFCTRKSVRTRRFDRYLVIPFFYRNPCFYFLIGVIKYVFFGVTYVFS